MSTELIEKVRVHCYDLMDNGRCALLQFHNWQHTEDVVENVQIIAKSEGLNQQCIEELIIAAYFHDLGNIKTFTGHEVLSCYYANSFLTSQKFPKNRLQIVLANIKATKMPQNPKTLSQKIMCDADLAHLGKTNFLTKNSNLRKEWEMHSNITFTDEQWVDMNLSFLSNHYFHTDSARKIYTAHKLENIKKLTISKQPKF